MLFGFLATVLFACAPVTGHRDESNAKPDQRLADELDLIKEEDSVIVPIRREQPRSQAP